VASDAVLAAVFTGVGIVSGKVIDAVVTLARGRTDDVAADLERTRADLAATSTGIGRELDSVVAQVRDDIKDVREDVKDVRDRVAGVEGYLRALERRGGRIVDDG
jgi:uncharacterized membrane protein